MLQTDNDSNVENLKKLKLFRDWFYFFCGLWKLFEVFLLTYPVICTIVLYISRYILEDKFMSSVS